MSEAMSMDPPRPPGPPTASSLANVDDFNALVSTSLADTRAAADKWRTGLAAFVTLITSALVIKGPQQTSDIPTGWRVVITVLLGLGLVLAVAGLWAALSASAGIPSTITFDNVINDYVSVKAFQIAQAIHAAHLITIARRLVLASIVLLFCGLFIWWWAPTLPTTTSGASSITTHSPTTSDHLLGYAAMSR